MSTQRDSLWDLPELSNEDQKIISAYVKVGKPLDQLPYSKDFRDLVEAMGEKPTDDRMFMVFQRLLTLRKRGRLPRLAHAPAEVF
jgi:hypothetical protein